CSRRSACASAGSSSCASGRRASISAPASTSSPCSRGAPVLDAAAWVLVVLAAATAGYWFRRLGLPGAARPPRVQAGPGRDPGSCDSAFALERLGPSRLPAEPELFNDIVRRATDRLAARVPGISLAAWKRTPAGDELVSRTGALADPAAGPLRVPESEWEQA